MKITLQKRDGDRITVLMLLEIAEGASPGTEMDAALKSAGMAWPTGEYKLIGEDGTLYMYAGGEASTEEAYYTGARLQASVSDAAYRRPASGYICRTPPLRSFYLCETCQRHFADSGKPRELHCCGALMNVRDDAPLAQRLLELMQSQAG